MKKNSVKIIVLAVILAAVCALVAYLAIDAKKDIAQTTESQSSVSETTTEITTQPTSETTTQTVTQTTTETTAPTTADSSDEFAFIKVGCWYLPDSKKEVCYAVKFNDYGNADVAFFNADNLQGFDAKYYEGDAKYTIVGNRIVIENLPSSTGITRVQLDVKGKDIKYNGSKLKNFSDMNLENALKCYK